jgi:hypothetical protein
MLGSFAGANIRSQIRHRRMPRTTTKTLPTCSEDMLFIAQRPPRSLDPPRFGRTREPWHLGSLPPSPACTPTHGRFRASLPLE